MNPELTSPLNETLDSLQYWIDMTNEIVLIAANTDNFAKELRYRSYVCTFLNMLTNLSLLLYTYSHDSF